MWFSKRLKHENADPHTLQEYGITPVCVCMRYFKVEFKENADPQTLQEYGKKTFLLLKGYF